MVHCKSKFSKNSLPPPPTPSESLRHWIHIMGFLHTLFIFLLGGGAEWSKGNYASWLFVQYSATDQTTAPLPGVLFIHIKYTLILRRMESSAAIDRADVCYIRLCCKCTTTIDDSVNTLKWDRYKILKLLTGFQCSICTK